MVFAQIQNSHARRKTTHGMVTFADFNIRVPSGATGNVKTTCPSCTPHQRKPQNRNAKDLSVSITDGVWQCWNCGWSGSLREKAKRAYQRPPAITLPLSDATVQWFKKRGITTHTLKHFGITEQQQKAAHGPPETWMLFPYLRNGQWVNVKHRDMRKHFRLAKDAELIIFNYDGVCNQQQVLITEGEIDALSAYEVGYAHVCSVPNGAARSSNQRLEYLDNSWAAFAEAGEVLLATDNDEAGHHLQHELARRLGRHRCKIVTYPDGCKDLNEVLVQHGPEAVWRCIRGAKPLPVEGILRLSDFRQELDEVWQHGFTPGVGIGYPEFDELLNFSGGQLTVVTGVPNSGKSAFLDQVLIRLASRHQWPIGVCSFENQPVTRHAASLAACYAGKPFYRRNASEKISAAEYMQAQEFLYRYFFWFKMRDEDQTPDGILARAQQLVHTQGIKALVIDPWNYLEHKRSSNQTETEYISEVISRFCNFAKEYDVHVFLVAHPVKIRKNLQTNDFDVPTLYDIAGSAHFFNKCDNGITIHRNRFDNTTTVYVQKIRFFYNGKCGNTGFHYDVHTGRFRHETEPDFIKETRQGGVGG